MNTIFAKKLNMTGKYTDKGERTGATILKYIPMKVKDLRSGEKHGYEAIRFELGNKIREVRGSEKMETGTEIKLEEMLKAGDVVNVTGISKGHGFTGVVKRHGFAGGPRTHGTSDRERAPGSSGSTTTPGRVYKGKRRAGRMGNDRVQVKGLKVLEINEGLITITGSVPGAKNQMVEVVKV